MNANPLSFSVRTPRPLVLASLAALAVAGCATGARDVPGAYAVGSVAVLPPGEGWKAIDLPDGETSFSSNAGRDDNGNLKIARRALVMNGAGGRASTVLVFSTSERIGVEGNGYVTRSLRCQEDQNSAHRYAVPLPTRPKQPSCAWAWPQRASDEASRLLAKPVLEGLRSQGVQLPGHFDFVVANVMNDSGKTVVVQALLPAGFQAAANPTPRLAPAPGFPPGLAAWADDLGRATVSAATSLSGKLAIPPGPFSDPNPNPRN